MRKIQFDGCAVPNPGEMGIGVVLIENNNTVTTISKKLPGKGTNNIAEYTALLTGVLKASELGWKEVAIEGDSKLVISQLNGDWAVKKEHLENLYNQVRKELSNFDSYTINWIPRENNSIADKLSCKALGYEEDPHRAFKNNYSYKVNKNVGKSVDIKCPKCKRDCRFNWQQFKNATKHIRQECPVHGYIRYAPKKEPYISLANQGDRGGKLIVIGKNADRIIVFFPYDKDYIIKIKSIPGYRFHKEGENKYWSFPLSNFNIKMIESIFEKEKLDIDPSLKNN